MARERDSGAGHIEFAHGGSLPAPAAEPRFPTARPEGGARPPSGLGPHPIKPTEDQIAMQQAGSRDALIDLIGLVRATGYGFTTVTPASHARVNARRGAAMAHDLRDVLGWSRPFRPEAISLECLDAMRRAGVVEPTGEGLRATIRLSSLYGELFPHSAYPPLEEEAVFFGPDTVRFVSAVIGHLAGRTAPVRRAVDIGAGSGAAGIAVAKRAPGAEVVLVDINPAALRAGAINAGAAGLSNIVPRRSDLLRDVEGNFDLVVSNPPFMIDRRGRTYCLGGAEIRLAEGESIHTDNSHKCTPDIFRDLARSAGWDPQWIWPGRDGSFSLHLLDTRPAPDPSAMR